MVAEPLWVQVARRYIGVAEIPGKDSNPLLVKWWLKGGAAVWNTLGRDDSRAPWCGTYVGECLDEVGLPRPQNWYRARAYLDYGEHIFTPVYGCIVVFARTGGGHVGFVVGRNEHGALMVLGGNQGDRVSIAAFDPSRVLGYRWPVGAPRTGQPLPRYLGNYPLSQNEA